MKKTMTGNKNLQKHEELMVDKTLIRRISSAKSTIQNKNTYFEKKLQNRNTKPNRCPQMPVTQAVNFQPTNYFASRPMTITQISSNIDIDLNENSYKDQQSDHKQIEESYDFDFNQQIQQDDQQKYENESIMCNMKSPNIKKKQIGRKKM